MGRSSRNTEYSKIVSVNSTRFPLTLAIALLALRRGEQETLQRIMNGLIAKNLELEKVMREFEKRVFYYRSQKFIEKLTATIVASISRGPNGKFVLGIEGLNGI